MFCPFIASIAFAAAKGDTAKVASPATSLGSKFYFPNAIGLSVPFKDNPAMLRTGFALNTAIEYRPREENSSFLKIDVNFLNNNYTAHQFNVPTNIIQGKLSSVFILMGAGYRAKAGRWAFFAEVLPGLGLRSYDKATINDEGVLISRVTNDYFALKAAPGIEYYIKKHFDIFFEPAYYKYFSHKGFNSPRSQIMSFNIGVATARF